ncbi:MAG: hypothetical protein Q9M92_17835 [Enterobacterales bacterium]|nr:hypothetical protein [Enterobacterales bacterium]
MFSLLLLGFLIGMRHAFEADHIAAVATLVSKTNSLKQAVKLGAIWGLGHTITLFLVGSIVFMTNIFIPSIVANWLEFVVGLMLVILGIDVLRRMISEKIHFHIHQHKEISPHFHAHSHKGENKVKGKEAASHCDNSHFHQHQHQQDARLSFRALFIGVLHGMAGSAALIILTLETIKSPLQGLIYISLFGFGSILGMAILSYVISIPLRASAKGLTWINNGLQLGIGGFTIILGSIILVDNAVLMGI